ncbi:uncharacterized protein LOC113558322 [Rhopalosiphum maidis]|uniref:uncharacterized protein LOC113557685 n=1 Tax=Rhopalosiphum maidis TaxID=43146 RepID=UPI000EFF3D77|nr:uncharacterized protein LOC113557685 [Rhopalosiphum maidis]XP_026819588.1 uncharacterized protein LOC113558322 [Rhopalosiphum maidis]
MPHSDKVDMLFIYWECQKNSRLAAQTYAQRYPDREHPVHSFFYNLERNLRTYGSFSKRVNNLQQRRGDALGEEVEENLLAYVRANPRSSTRHVGRELGISDTIVCKDGASAHNAHIVRDYLNAQFQNRWLGTYGPIEWPPRSSDLTPLDFFLWGHLKTIVYADPPINLQNLKDKITETCNRLTDEQITAATNKEFMRRAEACFVHGGEQFEQFIR